MVMDGTMMNQKYVVEEIMATEEEIHALKTIGIKKGTELIVVGNGYVEGSILVICKNVLLQLNPFFIKKIQCRMVNEKIK